MKKSIFWLIIANTVAANELSFNVNLELIASPTFSSLIVEDFLNAPDENKETKTQIKKPKVVDKSNIEKSKPKETIVENLRFKPDGSPLILLEQIKDFSQYGYTSDDITPLYPLDEYQKIKAVENNKIKQERKHRHLERNKDYEDQIDAFFN